MTREAKEPKIRGGARAICGGCAVNFTSVQYGAEFDQPRAIASYRRKPKGVPDGQVTSVQ